MMISLLRKLPKFTFATEVQKAGTAAKAGQQASNLTTYRDGQLVTRNAVVLKKKQDIQAYVIKTVQNYFRTTYKQGVTKNSALKDHGLDSLDSIEISMQIEEDLGYTISAETLPQFSAVSHYITYIEQVEAFKKDNNKNPLS